jgi:uncharacterized membrane protein (DUF485 family)
MFHEPAQQSGKDPAFAYKTRLGVWMFLFYALIYAGFVAINLTSPALMEAEVLWGLNLAVVYGFFLIIFALVLALIYNHLCGKKEVELAENHSEVVK